MALVNPKFIQPATTSKYILRTPTANEPPEWSVESISALATNNKQMTALVTVNDGDFGCATGLVAKPSSSSYVAVLINGIATIVGDGTNVGVDCYFTLPSNTTPKAFADLAIGDKIRWVGSYAGYQLDGTDIVDFLYDKTT